MKNNDLKKVLIIQRVIPDVRALFFNNLISKKKKYILNIISSDQFKNESYKLVNLLSNHKTVANFYIFKNIHFQNIFLQLLKSDLIIIDHALNSIVNLLFLFFNRIFFKKKIIFWGHGKNFSNKANRFLEYLKKYLLRYSDAFIGYTPISKKILIKNGYKKDIHILYNSNVDKFKFHKDIKHKVLKNFNFVYCGRINFNKNLNLLVNSFQELNNIKKNLKLYIIGEGPLLNNLKNNCLKNKNIIFTGSLYGEYRDRILEKCHCQVIPGSIGLSILQGFSLGVPLITNDSQFHSPEIYYLKNKKNGLMFKKEKDLIECMKYISSNFDFWRELSLSATETSKKYSLTKMINNFDLAIRKHL